MYKRWNGVTNICMRSNKTIIIEENITQLNKYMINMFKMKKTYDTWIRWQIKILVKQRHEWLNKCVNESMKGERVNRWNKEGLIQMKRMKSNENGNN